VPNTLATIFGIQAIADHLNWMNIVVILIFSTLVSGIGAYWVIQKKGWIPHKVH